MVWVVSHPGPGVRSRVGVGRLDIVKRASGEGGKG